LDFKTILTQEFFYQNANLGQVTAKSEKVEFFLVHPKGLVYAERDRGFAAFAKQWFK